MNQRNTGLAWARGSQGWLLVLVLVTLVLSVAARGAVLDTHTVVLDGEGLLVPWTANPSEGYDRVMFLSWSLLKNQMPADPANGLPVTYTHSEYYPNNLSGSTWPNNPAGKNAMLADSALLYYAYSGDYGVVDFVRGLLNHQLRQGTTPTNYAWAKVPWSTAAAGSINYGNDSNVEGVGILEPDKVGELGFHGYLRFFQLTGDPVYLNAALACADALAAHVRTGNATQSPWPFRVVAQTGAAKSQNDYCAHVIAPIRLFDELIRLGWGNTNAYALARQKAWNWLMTYPMSNRIWAAYFEDVGGDMGNLNQYAPGQTARYLLESPNLDTNWFRHVTNMLGFIETTFGGTDNGESGLQYGARVISEQTAYKYKMASHTSRFAAVNALFYRATGQAAAREKAYRSLNWATYMCRNNGVVIEGPAEYAHSSACWFTDGHGDYVRHFMLALGAVPEWSPAGQNHLLHSTSLIRAVNYAATGDEIGYSTFDESSVETLRLAFTPDRVLVNGEPLAERGDLDQSGWVFNPDSGVMRIRHDSGNYVLIAATFPTNACLEVLNPGFEGGFTIAGGGSIGSHWSEWESALGVALGYDETAVVHAGGHAQRIRVLGGTNGASGGVFQRAAVYPGTSVTISLWIRAGDNATTCHLGVDPVGGTNASAGVVWSQPVTNSIWEHRTWSGTAMGEYITIFFKVTSADNVPRNGYLDDLAWMISTSSTQLTAQTENEALTLCWPACPATRLEQADNLGGQTSWVVVTNPVSILKGQKRVSIPIGTEKRFFRLSPR